MPLERDEGEYAYAGQLILEGVAPYRLVYNMKLPGTYAAYAALMAGTGQSASGIHFGLIFINAATTLLIFFLATRLFGELAGAISAASYALLSTHPSVLGLAAHATHFVVFFAVAGIVFLLQAAESKRLLLCFASGILLGLAFLMKQPGALFVLFGVGYLFYAESAPPPREWKNTAAALGVFILGAALPFGATCLLMAKLGLFHNFWFWTFTYARQYASQVSAANAWVLFRIAVDTAIVPVWPLWATAAIGLTTPLWCGRARRQEFFVWSFVFVSIAAVCPGFYFRQHYFILMLPALSLLIGIAVGCGSERLKYCGRFRLLAALPVAILVAVFVCAVFAQRTLFFRMTPHEASRAIYSGNPFPETVDVAAFVRAHTSPDMRIAVIGSEPEIYFYSNRRSATGYIYTYPLMEEQKFALTMQKQMIGEIEGARPEYIVYVDVPASWLPKAGADWYIFAWAKSYLAQNYQLVGIDSDVRSDLVLPEVTTIQRPLSTLNIYLFRRKSP